MLKPVRLLIAAVSVLTAVLKRTFKRKRLNVEAFNLFRFPEFLFSGKLLLNGFRRRIYTKMASKFSKVEPQNYNLFKRVFQYFIVYFVSFPFFKVFFRAEIHGKENIPEGDSVIVASTHSSYFDPFIVCFATRRSVAFMAKEELFHVPVLSQLIQALGAFAVNREKLEIATIKSAKNILSKTNWFLGIFPEGTRVKGRKVGKINTGFGYLAKSTNSKILPVAIDLEKPICPLFGKLIVRIGKPIEVNQTPEEICDKWGQTISELIGYEYNKEESLKTETKTEETANL